MNDQASSRVNPVPIGDQTDLFGLPPGQATLKRVFDFLLACCGLLLTGWLIILAWGLATIDTHANGFFIQKRVGKNGCIFPMIKIRTMRKSQSVDTTVTVTGDPRITPLGRILRRLKIDEIPQLVNVVLGHMSFVGPRPDVPGFADQLRGPDRIILSVRPGITGPATLEFRNEEELLAKQENPEVYNREVIFPRKVQINREYIQNYSLRRDLGYILKTVLPTILGRKSKN